MKYVRFCMKKWKLRAAIPVHFNGHFVQIEQDKGEGKNIYWGRGNGTVNQTSVIDYIL